MKYVVSPKRSGRGLKKQSPTNVGLKGKQAYHNYRQSRVVGCTQMYMYDMNIFYFLTTSYTVSQREKRLLDEYFDKRNSDVIVPYYANMQNLLVAQKKSERA